MLETSKDALITLVFGFFGAAIFALVYVIPMPFVMVSLFKFSLIPALAIIATVGAIRGPMAGFLTGYIGLVVHDFVFFNTVLTYTLPAVAYGLLGFIVGVASYDLDRARLRLQFPLEAVQPARNRDPGAQVGTTQHGNRPRSCRI